MSEVGFRVNQSFERPNQSLIDRLKTIPSANIGDCMNRMACIDGAIRPLNSATLAGCAFTVRVPAGDNLMFHHALDLAKPGDILVIAGGGGPERALCGEIMVRYAMAHQLGGFILDGYIRDFQALSALDFPVYARGTSPNGPYKNGPGEIGYPVALGGQVIFPGDILIGDGDGVVVIRPQDAPVILEEAEAVSKKESGIFADIAAGKGMAHDWVEQTLVRLGCKLR